MGFEIEKVATSLNAAQQELNEVLRSLGVWISDIKEYRRLVDRREDLKEYIHWKLTGRRDY